jgi:tight adherence protein C
MNSTILMALLGLLIFFAVFLIGYAFLGLPRLSKRLEPETRNITSGMIWGDYLQKSEKVFKPLGKFIPRSPEEMSRQERRLVRAGIRRKDGPALLYGIKVSLVLVFLLTSLASGIFWKNPVVLIALSIFLGALLPDLSLNYLISRRSDRIQRALPNALDLTVVCVEAGMGLDQALMRIGEEMKHGFPELSEEFGLLGLEVNAGRKRSDALRNLANRTDSKDMKSMVAMLIQTDRFGTSIAQSLRVYSETMRSTRRLRAEEHAAKMGIKMLPALVVFIFPAILVVALGPAIIAITEKLVPILGK